MSGILPFADVYHPIWSSLANEIHAAFWHRVGLEVVQGFVREWASNWVNEFNAAQSSQLESLARVRQGLHYPDDQTLPLIPDNLPHNRQMQQAIDAIKGWQPLLPTLPLPPSHKSLSLTEKWAALAAVHDVFDLSGDKVLPWPLPEDDHDLVALTEWLRGHGGAFCFLMQKASKLRDSDSAVIRTWLMDFNNDTPPKAPTPNDISCQLERIEAAVATFAKLKIRRRPVDEAKAKKKEVERDLVTAWEKFRDEKGGKKEDFLKQDTKADNLIRQNFRDEMKRKKLNVLKMLMRIIERNRN